MRGSKERRYREVEAALRGKADMRALVDALWERFAGEPYSWVGFYFLAKDGRSMTLGPSRDKPACSPIAMHGVCGRCALEGRTIIVDDVHALGDAHIVCDPKNLSEICVPVRGPDGAVFAVLDVDSERLAAFDETDRRWLERLAELIG